MSSFGVPSNYGGILCLKRIRIQKVFSYLTFDTNFIVTRIFSECCLVVLMKKEVT